jgi:hypothetical protein
MAMLETYTVKPSGLHPMTIKALDENHLEQILHDLFTKGFWKGLPDTAPVEIKRPEGEVIAPAIKNFRS